MLITSRSIFSRLTFSSGFRFLNPTDCWVLHRHFKLNKSKIRLPSFPVFSYLFPPPVLPYHLFNLLLLISLSNGNNSMQSTKPDSWESILPLHQPTQPIFKYYSFFPLNIYWILSSFIPTAIGLVCGRLTTHLNYCTISWLIFPPLILPYPNLFLSSAELP